MSVRLIGLEERQLSMELPRGEERADLLRAHSPSHNGRGVQTFYPEFDWVAGSPTLAPLAPVEDPFEVPLLRCPEVRERLAACMKHPAEVLLILHAATVEIRDYRERRADIFFLSRLAPMLSPRDAQRRGGLDNRLRRLLGAMLPSCSAVMVHSSAVLRGSRVALLVARDEGGKTTAASLSHAGSALSDDRNILKRSGSRFSVHATPWSFAPGGVKEGPLGGIFLLKKAERFAMTQIKPRDAAQFIWDDNAFCWCQLPKNVKLSTFNAVVDAARSVPCYRLHFQKDHIDWGAVDRAMEKG